MKYQNLKIATWNIKNSYFHLSKNEFKVAAVIQLLKEQDLDVLALQEVNLLLASKINKRLTEINSNYQITSNYQKTKSPIQNLRVEYNMIISRLNPVTPSFSATLPYLPKGFQLVTNMFSIRKRFLVSQTLETGIVIDNTHLDHSVEELGKRQMKELANLVAQQRYVDCEVVLMGNLNRKPTEQNMIDFTKQLSELGMKVVENPHKTYIGHQEEEPVDYVIVPNSWEIQSVNTLENYDDISSHRPVVVAVKRKCRK